MLSYCKAPENPFIITLPEYKPMEVNMPFLLNKNTKSTSRSNKNKLVICIYLYLYIYIYIYIYIYTYNPMITPFNLARRVFCLSNIGRRWRRILERQEIRDTRLLPPSKGLFKNISQWTCFGVLWFTSIGEKWLILFWDFVTFGNNDNNNSNYNSNNNNNNNNNNNYNNNNNLISHKVKC